MTDIAQPKYKVGDTVRVIIDNHYTPEKGHVATVVKVYPAKSKTTSTLYQVKGTDREIYWTREN